MAKNNRGSDTSLQAIRHLFGRAKLINAVNILQNFFSIFFGYFIIKPYLCRAVQLQLDRKC